MTPGLDSEACDRFLSQLHFSIKNWIQRNVNYTVLLTDGTEKVFKQINILIQTDVSLHSTPQHTHENSGFSF